MTHGTASKMSTEQFREFAGAVLRSLPDDLETSVAQGWIGNQESLRRVLHEALSPNGKPTFLRDMTREDWELVEDVSDEPLPAANLELVSFLKRGESCISGEEMRRRAKEKNASLGQRQAEYLLGHQEEIPSGWNQFYLVFPGTAWRAPGGSLRVPVLYWHGGRWSLIFFWLGADWNSLDRLMRPRK